jgi:hypothetical protein
VLDYLKYPPFANKKRKKVALNPHSRYTRFPLKVYPVYTPTITRTNGSVYFRCEKTGLKGK